jgi:hypothetical protein
MNGEETGLLSWIATDTASRPISDTARNVQRRSARVAVPNRSIVRPCYFVLGNTELGRAGATDQRRVSQLQHLEDHQEQTDHGPQNLGMVQTSYVSFYLLLPKNKFLGPFGR